MTSLVIPVAVEPKNETLPIALWTAARHVGWLQPVLVGEPIQLGPYLDPDGDPARGVILPFMQQGLDPMLNTNRMMLAAIDDPSVTDPFVWSNDDIYFLKETDLDDIRDAGSTAIKDLRTITKKGIYENQSRETMAKLLGLNRPTWSYERHVPLLVHKDQMRAALGHGIKLNPRSIYQNLRLDQPAFIKPDVKAFSPDQLDTVIARDGRWFSTGSRFPIDPILEAVGYV